MATRGKQARTQKPSDAPEEKARYHHGDLRQALVDAAVTLITEEGFGALTLREVARRAGVTHAAPYRHFADKEALLEAVAQQGFRAMAQEMRERMAKAPAGPLEQLSAAGVAYVLFAVRHPPHFRVMFGPHFTRPLQPDASDEGTNAFALLVRCIEAGQAAGVLRPGESRRLTLAAWSMVHGLASLFVDRQLQEAGQGAEAAEALAVVQTRLLLEGLTRPGPG